MPEADITGKIIIHDSDGIHLLYASDITYCKADDNYTNIYIVNEKPLYVAKTLKVVEALLHNPDFNRCDRSILVNINFIKDFYFNLRLIFLLDKTKLKVSCRGAEELLKLLKAKTSLHI